MAFYVFSGFFRIEKNNILLNLWIGDDLILEITITQPGVQVGKAFLVQCKPLNVNTVNVNIKTTSYCYHLVNVISFRLYQSDHIKRLPLYFIFATTLGKFASKCRR